MVAPGRDWHLGAGTAAFQATVTIAHVPTLPPVPAPVLSATVTLCYKLEMNLLKTQRLFSVLLSVCVLTGRAEDMEKLERSLVSHCGPCPERLVPCLCGSDFSTSFIKCVEGQRWRGVFSVLLYRIEQSHLPLASVVCGQ